MLGKLSTSEIEQVLHGELVGRIGCYADGEIYVVPVSYAYDGQCVYVRAWAGKKITMMRKNPSVCFEVDSFQSMANWKSVIATGYFEEITDPGDRDAAVKILLNRSLPLVSSETMHITREWPFPPKDTTEAKGIIFRIRLIDKSGRFEKSEGAAGSLK